MEPEEDPKLAMQLAIAKEEYDHFKYEVNRSIEQQKTVNPLEGMEIDQGDGRKKGKCGQGTWG